MKRQRKVASTGSTKILHGMIVCLVAALLSFAIASSAPTVSAQSGVEGDVTPRPTGKNGAATQADVEQIGRFVMGLDKAQDGSEFQRADSAPRNNRGDGRIGIADLVQTLRYAAGFDEITPAAGPTTATTASAARTTTAQPEMVSEVRIGAPSYSGVTVTLPVELVAQGTENALGFSLAFDANVLSNPVAVLGTDATAALLLLNPLEVGSGRLGLGVALPPGQKFAAGVKQVLRVTFTMTPAAFGQSTPVGFASSPVELEIADEMGFLIEQRVFTGGGRITLNYPVPTISALNPGSAFAQDGSFTLGVIGTLFVPGSIVRWGTTNLATTFQSSTLLTATVPASLITTAGSANITVLNPTPGGGTSNALTFFINNRVPTLTGLSITTLAAGGGAGTLDVTGTGFVPTSVVFWNGRPCPTRYISATRLIVDYAAADIVCAGLIRVTVVSPAPGGGTSVAQTFSIVPTVASINPTLVYVGGSTFTLTVNGTGFCEGARIRVNGVARTSTVVGSTQITTTINASELDRDKTLQISVVTGDGVVSNNVPLPVSDCPPGQAVISSLSSAFDFGTATPARGPITPRTSRTFSVANVGCQPLTLSFAARRTGEDVTSGKITNTDDSGTFVLFNTTSGVNTEIRSGSTISIPGGRTWTFRIDFDPKIPAPAGRTTNLAASQVIPDVITSTFTIQSGATTVATSNLTGRVEVGSRFIDPLAPRLDPLVVFIRNGDEFTVEASGYDADTNIQYCDFQFYDQAGNRVGTPQRHDINLRSAGVLKGQSFSLVKKFTAKDTGLNANRVQVFFFDADGAQAFATSGAVGSGRGRIVNAASVSAASFSASAVTTEGIASAFGESLATKSEAAQNLPLPTELGDVKVFITDANLVERTASLFYVSPTQINYLIPEGTVPGEAKIVIANKGTVVANGTVNIAEMAPALFTANSDGKGVPAAFAVRVKANNQQSTESVAQFDAAQNKFVPAPISLGPPEEQVILVLFGTGVRNYSSMNRVSARIAGVEAAVDYAGPQGQYVGLDQVNIRIPRSLIVGGEVDLVLTVDGKASNPVRIHVR